MRNKTRLFISPLLILAFLLGQGHSLAQDNGQEYFPQSGHFVSGDFLTAYRSVPEPEKIYGYPITEAFQNPTTRRIVQYFEKAHFELRSEYTDALRVHRTELGFYLYQPGDAIPTPANTPGCRSFPETKFQVCYAFLSFFEVNGDVAQFGYPISEIEIHKNIIVQYFQRAVFEWHPELPYGERVVLSELGWEYFWLRKEDPQRLLSPDNRAIPKIILNLKIRAFPDQAVIRPNGIETLFVIVQDQNLLPIEGATVYFKVRYPSGREANYVISNPTDKYGVTRLSFRVDETTIGLAEILVTVNYNKFKQETISSFRLWW